MTVRHYLATSRRVKELFLAYVRVPITVLPPAISTEEYDHARRSMDRAGVRRAFGAGGEGVCLTVTVSRLTEGKGHDDLWPMLTALPVDGVDVRLLLVGEGDLRADLQWRADASGVGSRVVFAGTRGDVPEVLAAADLSVFPSHSEGLGLGVLEAMAAGLPVLAYDLPAYREFVEPGRSAVLVPTGDVPELSAAFSALVRDPQRAAELGRTARALVEQRYPIEGLASAVAQAYRLALGVTESA